MPGAGRAAGASWALLQGAASALLAPGLQLPNQAPTRPVVGLRGHARWPPEGSRNALLRVGRPSAYELIWDTLGVLCKRPSGCLTEGGCGKQRVLQHHTETHVARYRSRSDSSARAIRRRTVTLPGVLVTSRGNGHAHLGSPNWNGAHRTGKPARPPHTCAFPSPSGSSPPLHSTQTLPANSALVALSTLQA